MKLQHSMKRVYLILLVGLPLLLFVPASSNAQPVPPVVSSTGPITLAWDENSEEDLAGYKLHYGIVSGEYTNSVDVGKVTQYTIPGLTKGQEYFFAATAYNTEGKESDFSNEISGTLPLDEPEPEPLPDPASNYQSSIDCEVVPIEPPLEVIIDNGNPGTSFIGVWQPSSGLNFYGEDSLYIWEGPAYRYTYQSGIVGEVEVFLWWTNRPTRCRAVPVEIWDQDNLLATVTVDHLVNGGQWNSIGKYTFTGKARVVIKAQDPSCSTCADAVKFWRE